MVKTYRIALAWISIYSGFDVVTRIYIFVSYNAVAFFGYGVVGIALHRITWGEFG